MARQWVLNSQQGFETSMEYQTNVPIPSQADLKPHDVLVRIHAASLNYREIAIPTPTNLGGPIKPPLIPGCDGAGVVEAVGSAVTEFHKGDRVVTHLAPDLVRDQGDDAQAAFADTAAMLGQGTDGTLRSFGVFSEYALVPAPQTIDWLAAATLTCTWVTAWNALFGLEGRPVGPDSWVLVQGTGGVSVAVLQLAVAAGATVVATTSSEAKAARLRGLGAAHTLDYRQNPSWGKDARALTPGGRGFDFIIDVGGFETLPQSFAAVRTDGIVLVIGMVGDAGAEQPSVISALIHTCIVRGILDGSRRHYRDLVRYIDEKGIKPAVDDVVFELAEAKDAYRRLEQRKHFSKVVIRVDHE